MSSAPGIELERSIDSIRVGARHRTDLGDVRSLADSIQKYGLLQPITVTPEGVLVCGARRLAALHLLGLRKVNVWVRAGISDRLTQVLAEKDENTLRKDLTPSEAATLYTECKRLLAEDATHRQVATRFGATAPPGQDGAVKLTAPSERVGDSRAQAAAMATGNKSFTTLERIASLQRVAADETAAPEVRAHAEAAIAAVDAGAGVWPAFQQITGELAAAELERMARSPDHTSENREAAQTAAAQLRSGGDVPTGEKPELVARKALARARSDADNKARDAAAQVRRFAFTWNDLREWWSGYDPAVLAEGTSAEDWAAFEATLEGSLAFAEDIRRRRGKT
ncbi:ParB family chromosome partitioning protein [Microbacterium terrae]|uniref:Chromosome-partitioning protein Spo0J n=1 Tax=Microbacterium terrae TaxID=69369 RepID=A0A0M2H0N2_9MICO|nr:ParB/RepB/Spo0J family partition protein [Microbacterium terrae]KJL37575.1 Chromosome-partitioning protein Spo0J [Microbacterium terrae]MBP1076406.1 ParB family chromosome partitioning protein [Microbacterium terrae]GLJ97232.1 hypothetical protein GCM10017594_04290 [Microbacterium terrae]